MGGGILPQEHVLPRVRHEVRQLRNNYTQVSELSEQLNDYIVPPVLGDQTSVLGAVALVYTVRSQQYLCLWLCGTRY